MNVKEIKAQVLVSICCVVLSTLDNFMIVSIHLMFLTCLTLIPSLLKSISSLKGV